jgi:uncharacterized protein (UPF0333 family)
MTLLITFIAMIATWVGAYWTYKAANSVHVISKNIEVNEQTREIIKDIKYVLSEDDNKTISDVIQFINRTPWFLQHPSKDEIMDTIKYMAEISMLSMGDTEFNKDTVLTKGSKFHIYH